MNMCCIDYDPPSFITTKWRKARKSHKCCECGAVIENGYPYRCTRYDRSRYCKPVQSPAATHKGRDEMRKDNELLVSCIYDGGYHEPKKVHFTDYLTDLEGSNCEILARS